MDDGRPPRRTARAHRAFRLGLLVVGLLVACVAMMAATDSASAQGATVPDSGHHVVHDLHCESFTGPAAAVQTSHDAAPAVDTPAAGTAPVPAAACDAPTAGPHPPGRALLLTIGVDRT